MTSQPGVKQLMVLAVLLPVLLACEADTTAGAGPSASPTPGAAQQAARRACAEYARAPLWEAHEGGEGTYIYVDLLPVDDARSRVREIVANAAIARGEPRYAQLAAAAETLELHLQGDRSEITEASVQMTEVCDSLGTDD